MRCHGKQIAVVKGNLTMLSLVTDPETKWRRYQFEHKLFLLTKTHFWAHVHKLQKIKVMRLKFLVLAYRWLLFLFCKKKLIYSLTQISYNIQK